MKRFLQTLAIAAVMIFIAALPALAETNSCNLPGRPHISKILADAQKMAQNPDWEGMTVQTFGGDFAKFSASKLIATPGIFTPDEYAARMAVSEKLVVFIAPKLPRNTMVWFDKNDCFLTFTNIPVKMWEHIKAEVEASLGQSPEL